MKNTTSKEISSHITERVMFYFREISNIPRGSGNEAAIANYLVKFAININKEADVKRIEKTINKKNVHDVIISVPGTKGYENYETVILQAHIDMVCQKSPESNHDFFNDPIDYSNKDGNIKANGTTLGADDGIGVALILAVLESDKISHPPIEALFTSDEEEDMTGAMAVTRDYIKGTKLINIDTETEGVFYYGCAGGVNANFNLPAKYVNTPCETKFYEIDISGLQGGHSGVQIHQKHANAHKLLGRILYHLTDYFSDKKVGFSVAAIKGGDAKNVITLKATVTVGINPQYKSHLENEVQNCLHTFESEYAGVEPTMKITTNDIDKYFDKVLSDETQKKLLSALILIPNDVLAQHTQVKDLVETSCNLGVLSLDSEHIEMVSFIRSFFESKKQYVVNQMKILADFIGANFTTDADFPNWEPNPDSELMSRFQKSYKDVFGKEPVFESIHAGLECGHFARIFPEMDMIACGPTITGAHTIDESLDANTVGMVVELLIDVLQKMNEKAPVKKQDCCNVHFMSGNSEKPVHVCQCVR